MGCFPHEHRTPSLQEELESRAMLFRDFGDPVAGFSEALEASAASLVRPIPHVLGAIHDSATQQFTCFRGAK
jgi:hypothetical protein